MYNCDVSGINIYTPQVLPRHKADIPVQGFFQHIVFLLSFLQWKTIVIRFWIIIYKWYGRHLLLSTFFFFFQSTALFFVKKSIPALEVLFGDVEMYFQNFVIILDLQNFLQVLFITKIKSVCTLGSINEVEMNLWP